MNEEGIFSEQTLKRVHAQEEGWQRSIEGQEAAELEATTFSGIKLKPVYSPKDITEMKPADIPLPGQYPYARGFNPLGYRAEPWAMFTGFGFSTAADTRKRWEFLRSIGATGRIGRDEEEEMASFRLFIDLPTQRGYDPDEPEARGRIGGCGISLSNMEDMKLLFDGVPLDKVCVQFIIFSPTMAAYSLYIAYAQTRGYSPIQLFMRGQNQFYTGGLHQDVVGFPPQSAIRLMTEYIYYYVKNTPRSQHTSLNNYAIGENGGNAVQQLAILMALAMAVTEECVKVGLDPDDVTPGFYTHEWGGIDLFEEVAKIRAKRRLWAKVFKERFGCKKSESLQVKFLTQTAGSLYIAQEPLNNIIRATVMALAGVLAGVDGLHVCTYDEPLCVPTEEAARIAIRTQQVLYHETSLPYVVDPLGGSYYVEWLTNKIEEDVLKYFDKMDELGGFVKCWETGWIRRELELAANERQRKIDSGEVVIVGQNKYRLPDEQQPEISLFPAWDPEIEEEAIARVRKYREQRDQWRVDATLSRFREVAEAWMENWPKSCGTLMPTVIDAFLNQATMGEVQKVLQQVCGYTYYY